MHILNNSLNSNLRKIRYKIFFCKKAMNAKFEEESYSDVTPNQASSLG